MRYKFKVGDIVKLSEHTFGKVLQRKKFTYPGSKTKGCWYRVQTSTDEQATIAIIYSHEYELATTAEILEAKITQHWTL